MNWKATLAARLFFLVFAGSALVFGIDASGGVWGTIALAALAGVVIGALVVAWAYRHTPRAMGGRRASAIGILGIGVGSVLSGSYPNLLPFVLSAAAGFFALVAVAAPATFFRSGQERWDDEKTWIGED